jgi:predicted Zn-dependent peptidase
VKQNTTQGESKMENTGYSHFAEALVFAHGNRAAGEAARHAQLCERSGDTETADTWRKVQAQVAKIDFSPLRRCA